MTELKSDFDIGCKIPLSQGKYAIVDAINYDWLMQWKWYLHSKGYAVRSRQKNEIGEKPSIFMHRILMKIGNGKEIDHRNCNKLDNRISNLRLCTRTQNHQNRPSKRENTSSKYKGVHWNKQKNKWKATLVFNKRAIHLGFYSTEEMAANAYNIGAEKYFGDFSRGNGALL